MAWVKLIGYEVDIDDTRDIVKALVNELVDPKAPYFGTYEEAKAMISLEIKLPQAMKRGRKQMEKILKETKNSNSLLLLIEGKEYDIEEEEGEVEELAKEEESEEEGPPKKKEKVIITIPTNSSLVVFTRCSTKSRKRLKL